MRTAGLEDTQAGIKTVGRIINNLRYEDDTTLVAEIEEELNNFLMKVNLQGWVSQMGSAQAGWGSLLAR